MPKFKIGDTAYYIERDANDVYNIYKTVIVGDLSDGRYPCKDINRSSYLGLQSRWEKFLYTKEEANDVLIKELTEAKNDLHLKIQMIDMRINRLRKGEW